MGDLPTRFITHFHPCPCIPSPPTPLPSDASGWERVALLPAVHSNHEFIAGADRTFAVRPPAILSAYCRRVQGPQRSNCRQRGCR